MTRQREAAGEFEPDRVGDVAAGFHCRVAVGAGFDVTYIHRRSERRPVAMESPSALIDRKIKELGDWRGKMLAKVRGIIHEADPEIVEEWKWVKPTSPGTPVFSRGGIVCTGETHKDVVKMTFAKGAALRDPSGL